MQGGGGEGKAQVYVGFARVTSCHINLGENVRDNATCLYMSLSPSTSCSTLLPAFVFFCFCFFSSSFIFSLLSFYFFLLSLSLPRPCSPLPPHSQTFLSNLLSVLLHLVSLLLLFSSSFMSSFLPSQFCSPPPLSPFSYLPTFPLL